MDWQIGPPMADFAATFGESQACPQRWNYPVTYDGKGNYNGPVAIGFNPISNVPGLGTVNIAQALNAEINKAQPSTWGQLHLGLGALVQPEPAVPPDVQQCLPRGLLDRRVTRTSRRCRRNGSGPT